MTPPEGAGAVLVAGPAYGSRSEKVLPWHQDRLAVVYVRQSTVQQVQTHQESTRLQYGLTRRAQELGWAADRVLVIDEDLGKSGASAEERAGFQRLVSEVSLDHVGLILGVEMSRLARSNADWHRLLELCALFGTLLADADGIYDPSAYNDRLLLGLKGTMSEAELHLLKQRMYQGKLNKARRGELVVAVPLGYVRRLSGEVTFDPDEQVQHVVRLVFRKFEELGTLNALLHYLVTNDIRLGIRSREGPAKGELEWRRPNRMTLQNLLKNPIYAGAYAYGRRQVDRRRQPRRSTSDPSGPGGGPRSGPRRRATIPAATWHAFLPDRYPAYITWEQYEQHQAQLQANQARAAARGAVRRGPALLAGLLVCGRCGHRLLVRYSGTHPRAPRSPDATASAVASSVAPAPGSSALRATYVCARLRSDYGGPVCQYVAAPALESFVSEQALTALAPAALELSLAAAETLERDRADLLRLWQQRRDRAAYEAERAGRQFHLVDPEHRLVARQLEREWEAKLAAQQQLEEDYDRFLRHQPRGLTDAERATIRQLATDLPALWHAPSTTDAERKLLLRPLIDRVLVDVVGDSERVQVTITWAGGMQTQGVLLRPVARLDQLTTYPALCDRVRTLAQEGLRAEAIAARLNAEGFRPPKRRDRFGAQGVLQLMQRLGLDAPRSRSRSRDGLAPDEWWLPALAQELAMPRVTLYHWVLRGWVRARRPPLPSGHHRLALWADATEVQRLRARRQRPPGEDARQWWAQRVLEAGPGHDGPGTARPMQ